jgi:succinate dehydrogenase / fumarate reductase cytochrome b subunit
VYHNFIVGFQSLPVAVFYVVAMILLCMHLWHGVWSMCQTMGLSHPRYRRWAKAAAWAISLIVLIGNVSFPVAVQAGLLK